MRLRHVLVLIAGVLAGVLAMASVAWACTAIMKGTTSVNVASAQSGDMIVASASGLSAEQPLVNRQWMLHFLNFTSWQERPDMGCMGEVRKGGTDVVIGGPVESSGGSIPATIGVIPLNAHNSTDALVCFIEWAPAPGPYDLASDVTGPATLAITDIVPL